MTTEIVNFETPELLAIEKSKAKQIKETFEPMVKMLEDFEEIYNEIIMESEKGITKELCAKAKRTRLDIGKVRISTDKARLSGNEESQREIKARNGVAHLVTWAVSDKESKLKDIETHFETLEKERLEALQKDREEQLSKYIDDANERRLSDMEDDVWNAYLSAKKKEYEDRIEAEKQAELDRIAKEKAEAEAREQQRIENERLKAEAEKREKEIEAERKKQADLLAKQKAESDRLAKIEADKQAKIQAELDAKLKKEQEDKAKLEAELKAKKDAEIKAENERRQAELKAKAEAEKLAKAPIKEQLNKWVDGFSIELPSSELLNNEKALLIKSKFDAFKKWAKTEIESI